MNKNKKEAPVMLLEGGFSTEREISFRSAACVRNALQELGYKVISFDMAEGVGALKKKIDESKPFVVFNALHGG